ncbi:MAG: SprT-like domain-containing protein [Actinobacteria bacterium]|nr:SprT-like domain-containing protein [Actinomycetota bacterium]
MNITEAQRLARKLMDDHGLRDIPFAMNRRKSALGVCKFLRPRYGMPTVVGIELSQYWTPHLSDAEVKDTILHEIAHALAGFNAGHGYKWKAEARRIGANPTRTAEAVPAEVKARVGKLHAKYSATCRSCGQVYYFNRMGKSWKAGRKVCGSCRGTLSIQNNA